MNEKVANEIRKHLRQSTDAEAQDSHRVELTHIRRAIYGLLDAVYRQGPGPKSESTDRYSEGWNDALQAVHCRFGFPGGPTVVELLNDLRRR
jgi:hypothetical protein